VLDEKAFGALVAGKAIKGGQLEIILADIPWNRMIGMILDALAGEEAQSASLPPELPPDPPQAREFLPRKNPRR
jgi:hypothetical protein